MREREKVRAAAVAALGTPESMKPRSEAPTPTLPQVWFKIFLLQTSHFFEILKRKRSITPGTLHL